MVNLLIKVGMFILGGCLYIKGETDTKWLGKTDKIWKYLAGIPVALWCLHSPMSWLPALSIGTFFLASWALPYGEKSPLTKWFGKSGACAIHGAGIGLASYFVIGWASLLAMVISGSAFYVIHELDDAGKAKEPWVAIYRAVTGFGCLLGA